MSRRSHGGSTNAAPVRLLALHQARLRQILAVAIGSFCVLAIINAMRGRPAFVAIYILLLLPLLWALWRNRHDRPERIVAVIVVTLMLGIAVLIGADQRLYDEGMLAFPVILIFAGMYGSRRLLFTLTGLTIAFILALYVLDRTGILPSAALPINPARAITMSLVLGIAGFFVWLLASDLRRALRNLDREQRALMASRERIEMLAQRDALTGLPNRAQALDRLEGLLAQTERNDSLALVMLLDLDNFKTINDSLGHAAGDLLLRQVANRLESSMRNQGMVARLSGDEFLILTDAIQGTSEIDGTVHRILTALKQPFAINGLDVAVTASLGVTVAPQDGHEADSLLRNADIAMYQAKDAGRNDFRFFAPSMDQTVLDQMRLASELYTALARGELQVHYQPELDLRTNTIVGAEALLRWYHPTLGAVPPDKFIPIAERSGLIDELGFWVLRQACLDAVAWREHGLGTLTVAVNVSPMQFRRNTIGRDLKRALSETGLVPERLILELTESLLINDPEHLNDALRVITSSGVRIAIDDFGTGYSNLGYLRHFAVHRLKIDRFFIERVCDDLRDEGLVRAIIEMGHSLGLETVAEGVENTTTIDMLKELGCEFAQGLYWAPAMPADEFVSWVQERQPITI